MNVTRSFLSSTHSLSPGFELPREENVEEPLNSSIHVYNLSSSSSSSDDYSPSSSDDEAYNQSQRNQLPPALPPKSPANTIRPLTRDRAESIKSNSSSVRTITKSSSDKGDGVIEKLVVDSASEGVKLAVGAGGGGGGGGGKKGAWRVGKLV